MLMFIRSDVIGVMFIIVWIEVVVVGVMIYGYYTGLASK